MSIFTRATQTEQQAPQEEVFEAPVYEGYGVDINGDLIALEENMADRLEIVKTIHAMDSAEMSARQDIRSLQESGADQEAINARLGEMEVAMEASMKDAWEAIKSAFKKLWGKLVSFFADAVRSFDALTRSAEGFATKYGDKLPETIKYKGYKYTNLGEGSISVLVDSQIQSKLDAVVAAISDPEGKEGEISQNIEALKNYKTDKQDLLRGEALGHGGALNAQQFKEALFSTFRNGAKSGDTSDQSISASELVSSMKNKKGKSAVLKMKADIDKEFGALLKRVNELQSKVKNSSDKKPAEIKHGDENVSINHGDKGKQLALEALRTYASIFSFQKGLVMEVFRSWRAAWSECDRVYKSAALGSLKSNPAKQTQTEIK
jgi:hypothetical protein